MVAWILDFLLLLDVVLGLQDLVQLLVSLVAQFFEVDELVANLLNLAVVVFLLLDRAVAHLLEVLHRVCEHLKAMAQRHPLCALDEALGLRRDLFLVRGYAKVNVDVVLTDG